MKLSELRPGADYLVGGSNWVEEGGQRYRFAELAQDEQGSPRKSGLGRHGYHCWMQHVRDDDSLSEPKEVALQNVRAPWAQAVAAYTAYRGEMDYAVRREIEERERQAAALAALGLDIAPRYEGAANVIITRSEMDALLAKAGADPVSTPPQDATL